MPLTQSDLRAASTRRPTTTAARSLDEARRLGIRSAFLCHSHQDRALAEGLVQLLAEGGCALYVDWADPTMPTSPSAATAHRIQEKIRTVDLFLFLATENSMASRWCPWEIGYADGKKPRERIVIVPTVFGTTTFGNEYLQLYRRLDGAKAVEGKGPFALFDAGATTGVFLEDAMLQLGVLQG